MVFVCSLESIKRIETEFITSHFPVIVYGINCWKKIDNLWLPCSEGVGMADGLTEWNSNPRSKIFGRVVLPLRYWGLLRSLTECELKLCSALTSIFGIIVDKIIKKSDIFSKFHRISQTQHGSPQPTTITQISLKQLKWWIVKCQTIVNFLSLKLEKKFFIHKKNIFFQLIVKKPKRNSF